MPFRVQTGGVVKYGIGHLKLRGALVHSCDKGFLTAADMLGKRHSRIVCAADDGSFEEILYGCLLYTSSWHGMPTEEVPESLYDAEGERNGTSNWEMRNFEFGMMNLPNPAYTLSLIHI